MLRSGDCPKCGEHENYFFGRIFQKQCLKLQTSLDINRGQTGLTLWLRNVKFELRHRHTSGQTQANVYMSGTTIHPLGSLAPSGAMNIFDRWGEVMWWRRRTCWGQGLCTVQIKLFHLSVFSVWCSAGCTRQNVNRRVRHTQTHNRTTWQVFCKADHLVAYLNTSS